MRILIIEDEQSNADRLRRLILQIDSQHVIIDSLSSNAAVRSFFSKPQSLDLILSDIQLGDGLSFESLQSAPKNVPIIFTTAYGHYAIQAFKYNSIDYLLKPIDIRELQAALNKVMPVHGNNTLITTDVLNQLLASSGHLPIRYRERFLFSYNGDEHLIVPVNEVSLIGINDGLVCIYTKGGKSYPVNMSLEELEKQLNPHCFMRVNRQYIVQASDVMKLSTLFHGKLRVHIGSFPDIEITVSRDKASSVKKWLGS